MRRFRYTGKAGAVRRGTEPLQPGQIIQVPDADASYFAKRSDFEVVRATKEAKRSKKVEADNG